MLRLLRRGDPGVAQVQTALHELQGHRQIVRGSLIHLRGSVIHHTWLISREPFQEHPVACVMMPLVAQQEQAPPSRAAARSW